jgi:hypothetical protein
VGSLSVSGAVTLNNDVYTWDGQSYSGNLGAAAAGALRGGTTE